MTQNEIKNYLASQICEAMYMELEELEEETLFSDFGLESSTLVRVLSKINEKYAVTITVEELLSHQTLNATSAYIYEKITIKNRSL